MKKQIVKLNLIHTTVAKLGEEKAASVAKGGAAPTLNLICGLFSWTPWGCNNS